MSFFGRAATIAAIFSAAAALLCGTPGLAIGLDRLPLIQLPGAIPDTSLPDIALKPAVAFESLADAVAAQDAADRPEGELACLAGAVFYESHGEPLAGQLAVAEVILNRAGSGRFPASACGVVTQRGQFSFVRDGQMPAVAAERAGWRTAVAVARVAMAKAWASQAPAALFFHARRTAPGWSKTQIASIGNHVFYR